MTRFLTILLTGIVIGILIAPDKGVTTRRRLSDLLAGFTEGDDDLTGSSSPESFPSGLENRAARENL
jgi:hypothetical protein